MKVVRLVEEEVNVKYLKCNVYPMYIEDAFVDFNPDDSDEPMMPCLVKHENGTYSWNPVIDIDTGRITNWGLGVSATLKYKVRDEGNYELLNDKFELITGIYNVYVPEVMCPNSNGFGDYIDMVIDSDGFIKNWKKENVLHEFDYFQHYRIVNR